MSPRGIPLFYASNNSDTAVKELKINNGGMAAVATFLVTEDIPIIDLI